MEEYRKLLVLQYLDKAKENYRIQTILEKIGLEEEIGDKLIEEMFAEGLICYENFLISISEKGRKMLNEISRKSFYVEDGNIVVHKLVPEEQRLKEFDIYIPKKF